MSDGFDEQKRLIEALTTEVKDLKGQNQKLQMKVQEMEDRINQTEQQDKEKNLIISGIPKQTDEPKTIIQKVFSAMKVDVNDSDIQEAHYISKKENAPIVVKFKEKVSKQKVQMKVKQLKGIKVNECGLFGENKNIYFNDDLTRVNQQLFKKSRDVKKDNNFRAAYVYYGRIYIKKNENEEPIRIRNESDLKKIQHTQRS